MCSLEKLMLRFGPDLGSRIWRNVCWQFRQLPHCSRPHEHVARRWSLPDDQFILLTVWFMGSLEGKDYWVGQWNRTWRRRHEDRR